jgi:hypothetical protein
MPPDDFMVRRLRISGILVIFGLLIEAFCLVWSRPIAFVVLVGLGGALIGLGVVFFLHSLISAPPHTTDSPGISLHKQ